MSDEPELTAEVARQLFGRKDPNKTEPESQSEPTEPTEPASSTKPAQIEKLSADELELCRRYGLTPETVKRVRGEDWSERCADAERLAALAKPAVNAGEIAALAAHQQKHVRQAERWTGGDKS
jgi:hypothetical protein